MALYDARRDQARAAGAEPGWLQKYFADMMRGTGQQNPRGVGYGQGAPAMGDPMLDAAMADAAPEQQMEEVIAYGQQPPPPQMPTPSAAPPNLGPGPGAALPGAMGQPTGPAGTGGGAGGGMAPTAKPPLAGAEGPPSIYEGMSEEQLSQMAGMGDLDRQLAQAETMRDQENLKGRYINPGRTYVGDSPIAHAVRGWGIYKGRKEAERLGGEQTEGRRTFIDLLRNRGRPAIDDEVDRFQEL